MHSPVDKEGTRLRRCVDDARDRRRSITLSSDPQGDQVAQAGAVQHFALDLVQDRKGYIRPVAGGIDHDAEWSLALGCAYDVHHGPCHQLRGGALPQA